MITRNDNILYEYRTRRIEILSESEEEPISLSELKQYLKITHDHEDLRLSNLIKSVRDFVEQYTKYSLLEREVKYVIEDYEIDKIGILPKPLREIKNVIIHRMDGSSHEMSNLQYRFDEFTHTLKFKHVMNVIRLDVIFTCGYSPKTLPHSLKEAMLQHIAQIYDQNIEINNPPKVIKMLYSPFRAIRII